MRDFRSLRVWRRAHGLCLATYRVTKAFPPDELYGLTAQMRRAAVSVPSNIAEGCGCASEAMLGRYLETAGASCSELEYQALLALDLEYIEQVEHAGLDQRITDVRRMLAGLLRRLGRHG